MIITNGSLVFKGLVVSDKNDKGIGANEDMLENVVDFNFKIISIYQWQMKRKL